MAPQFPATRWSVVVTASGCGTHARVALEELCSLYWFPLYAFARQRGWDAEGARDETQEFMARIAAGEVLSAADPHKGRLRTYLLAVFQRDLTDSRRHAGRQKRGGGVEFVPLDAEAAEERLGETPPGESPGAAYDRAWAISCLDAAVNALAAEYDAKGRAPLFAALREFLDPGGTADYNAAAQVTGMNQNAVRQAVFRLRHRFRIALRQTVSDTLVNPTEALIDEELTALRAVLQS